MIDGANHRLLVTVVGVGREGFVLRYQTWANTSIWAPWVNWIAVETDHDLTESEINEISFGDLGEDVSQEKRSSTQTFRLSNWEAPQGAPTSSHEKHFRASASTAR